MVKRLPRRRRVAALQFMVQQDAAAQDINRWMADGRLKARVGRILPLSKAAEAHRIQEESTIHKKSLLAGKIVLKP